MTTDAQDKKPVVIIYAPTASGKSALALKIAKEKNGVIQAIENNDKHAFILGVQWHPEFMIYQKSQRKLFSWFIDQVQSEELISHRESFAT